jgi:glycosyltransferase involved in cell wall biosynthesis
LAPSVTTRPVVVDLQALQSPDFRDRGIARYAYELALALEQRHGELIGRYLLNPSLPPPGDLGPLVGSGKLAYAGQHGAGIDGAKVLHALSPFELGVPISDVWPRWAHEAGLRFCASVYDLIPLEHPETYLNDAVQRITYMARLEVLRAADGLLTISAATTNSVIANLGIPASKVHMVGTGTSARFQPADSPEQAWALAHGQLPGLERRFVLYPAGSDGRKNVEALVVAFSRLPDALRSSRQLVIVGQLPASMANHFYHVAAREGVDGRVLCTGYVPDETMLRLYQSTELLCFPSLMEGYGLPVAEAMACGAVAIVSDIEPLAELVRPQARFNPRDPTAISAAIERALVDKQLRQAVRQDAKTTVTHWSDVADRTAAVYEELLDTPPRPWPRRKRQRIAFMSPFPPVPSGIAQYSFRLVEELARLSDAEIDCFADGLDRSVEQPQVPQGLNVYDARSFLRIEAATAGYDKVVYVLGNGEFHTAALATLRHRSGFVLAHDVRLSGLYGFATNRKDAVPEGLSEIIKATYGPGLPDGLGASGKITSSEAERYGLLLARAVIRASQRFLVTSKTASWLARIEAGPQLEERVGVVGFAVPAPSTKGRCSAPIPDVDPRARVIASFGIVDPIKQPQKLVSAFAVVAAEHPDSVLSFVGPVSEDLASELKQLAQTLGLGARVIVTGRVEDDLYSAFLQRACLAVQLRASFSGEASAAVGDCLSWGIPMVVTDTGWMGELPDAVTVKVPVDIAPGELAHACLELLGDQPRCDKLSSAARSYAASHSFAEGARRLLEVLDEAELPQLP